ncbi:MAG: hypothetical protein EXS37_10635 [Opitutus sp.]|nr:hypothetical protein [Opitutus sp.]
MLLQSHDEITQHQAPAGYLNEVLERLVRLYTDWDQPEKSAEWKAKLDAFNQTRASVRPGAPTPPK